jgi:hypothetical protein
MTEKQQGQKHDDGKPRLDYLDPYAMEEVAKVLTFGATKYGAYNWQKGIESGRLIAACLRHVFAFMRGEKNDPESGLSHLAHAMCCLMFLIWMVKHKPEMTAPKVTVEFVPTLPVYPGTPVFNPMGPIPL